MVCMVVESVAWGAHIVCRSDDCLMLLWMKVERPRLLCDYDILLFDRTLVLGHYQSLTMPRISLIPHFLQLTETDQSTPALAMRTSATAVLFSPCCFYAPSSQEQSIGLRDWQVRPGWRSEVGSRGGRLVRWDFEWKSSCLVGEAWRDLISRQPRHPDWVRI